MDDGSVASEEGGRQGGRRGRLRRVKVAILGGAAVLVIVALAGVWFLGLLPHHRQFSSVRGGQSAAAKPILVDVPDIVANLDNGGHRPVFIKLVSKIEVSSLTDRGLILANMPGILDAAQTYLRSTRPEEVHGGDGTYRLREALMSRIDIVASPARVLNVLFVEMLIQ